MTNGIRMPRPRSLIRRWTTGLLAVLFLVGLDALWDYREARRVSTTIERLRAAGVRTRTTLANASAAAPGPTRDSAALYAAAALLAGSRAEALDAVSREVDASLATGQFDTDRLARLGATLSSQQDIFDLVDRAGSLPFSGFAPGTTYGYQLLYVARLYRLCGLRTIYHAARGDADETATSLLTELAMIRAAGSPLVDGVLPSRFATAQHIALALVRTSLADPRLLAVASGLQEADDDGALARQLNLRRARSIETFLARARYGAAFSWDRMLRPFAARVFLQNLDRYGQKVGTTTRPWPERLDVTSGTVPAPVRWFAGWIGEPAGLPAEAVSVIGRDLAGLRAAELAIAVERYRLARAGTYPATAEELVPEFIGALPIDPYSGRPMRFQQAASEFVVYSIGPDRTDNSGNLTGAAAVGFTAASRQTQTPVGDIGLRLTKKTGP